MKIQTISRRVLYVCNAIILVCFVAFFTVGYDNPVGDYNEPKMTEALLWLMYALSAITTILSIWSVIKGVQATKGTDLAMTTGVPGGKISFFTNVLLFGSLAFGYIYGIDATEFVAADGTVTSAGLVTITEMFLWSIYILTIVAVLAVAVSMSGVMTKKPNR